MQEYSGGNEVAGQECSVAPSGEACTALRENLSPWSYLLNSIWTHRSCRYAKEGVLAGFATESALAGLDDPNIVMFSPRNSEGFVDPASDFHAPLQDDYDTWAGESALVRWGSGSRAEEGWIRNDRFHGGANYVYADSHVKFMRWGRARIDQFPDHKVRYPLADPPR
jgi:prepilin-type processing-associated H-X9-DG protein